MATVTVHSPNSGFAGTVAGVTFEAGVGVVDEGNDSAIAYFRRQGYRLGDAAPEVEDDDVPVADAPVEVAEDPEEEIVDLPGAPPRNGSRRAWAEYAEGLGVDTEALTRNQIIAAAEQAAAE